jgi:hypothetical protein
MHVENTMHLVIRSEDEQRHSLILSFGLFTLAIMPVIP